jgi:hypothetical protein
MVQLGKEVSACMSLWFMMDLIDFTISLTIRLGDFTSIIYMFYQF